MSTVQCSFYILNRADPADSRCLHPRTGPTGGFLTDHPPVVGDLIWLSGSVFVSDEETEEVNACWRVVARSWSPAAYGSMSWPAGTDQQATPVHLDVMLERSEGLFAAKTPAQTEENETRG